MLNDMICIDHLHHYEYHDVSPYIAKEEAHYCS